MKLHRRELLALAVLLSASTRLRADPSLNTPVTSSAEDADGVRWVTLASGHKVWTRRVGSGRTKLLLLHGGPGLSHDYMECFADFLPQAGYELYFYDQLGCGRSDKPEDASLWTLPRYLQEVEEVRTTLGLDRFTLVGHSWGAILALEYALSRPQHLNALVLSNMSASFSDYASYTRQLRDELPETVKTRLATLEAAGEVESADYQQLITENFYAKHICRLDPWPTAVQRSLAGMNPTVYLTMQGPNEFTPTGNLKDWDRWSDLNRVTTPTIVMGARYDEMNPASLRREAEQIPGADLFISESGSHLAMWDDQQPYFAALASFLAKHRA